LVSVRAPVVHVFSDPPGPTVPYTLSLHDALPISCGHGFPRVGFDAQALDMHLLGTGATQTARQRQNAIARRFALQMHRHDAVDRSEEHTSELQSRRDLVCRLLLEKRRRGPSGASE